MTEIREQWNRLVLNLDREGAAMDGAFKLRKDCPFLRGLQVK